MKVCIIGDFSDNLDEGLKNIAHHIAQNISNMAEIQILKVNLNSVYSMSFFSKIHNFEPDIIHYIPGPTNKSIILLKVIKYLTNNSPKFVLSAPYPLFNDKIFSILNFRPDHVFASSRIFMERMVALDIPCSILANGVDLNKYIPVTRIKKLELRKKYGLKEDAFTLLHVGHLMDRRNLKIFMDISQDIQAIVVASSYIETDGELAKKLGESGCVIFRGYNPNIEELYQLSDCYIFPVKPGDSILCPLSIMEAMACNLPIITTKFDGIETIFCKNKGIIFVENYNDFFEAIESIYNINNPAFTREAVLQYSWENISNRIVNIYRELINSR